VTQVRSHTTASSSRLERPLSRVLFVDDDVDLCHLFERVLEAKGFLVQVAHSASEALARVDQENFDGILLDVMLGDENGIEVMGALLSAQPTCKIMVLTANGCVDTAVEAMKQGATGFFTKDKGADKIVEEFMDLLNVRRTAATALGLGRGQTHGLYGQSPQIQNVIANIDRMAGVDSTVLITGESGTGKELVARGLHSSSPRSHQPFAAINCGAIPENLLESELFGHKRGSFTDAKADRKGIFELCSEGTLLLDEIGDMPLPLQVKLLRVLQDKEIRPVGSSESIKISTRVIAATHRNLDEEAAHGRFRSDLFYRLSVLRIDIPPLRRRREDIPVLVEHFIKVFNERFARRVQFPRPEIMARLQAYDWPGNVRELQNMIERGVVLAPGGELSLEDMFSHQSGVVSIAATSSPSASLAPLPYQDARETFNREYLVQLLRFARGNVSEAARISGQCRPQLYRLLHRLELNPDEFKIH